MAKYKIAHRLDRTWVGLNKTGDAFEWVPYERSLTFQNYFKAKAALETLPLERDSYNFPLEHHFMKVGE